MSGFNIRQLPALTDTNGRVIGFISANGQEVFFPTFTQDQNALVKPDGTLLAGQGSGPTYTLPPATTSMLGGIKVGSGLAVAADGTVMATASGGASYTLPVATASVLGGVKAGSGVAIAADGTLSTSGGTGYTLPAATTTTLGGIKVGANLTVGTDGTLNASAGGSASGSTRVVYLSSVCTADATDLSLTPTVGTDQRAKVQTLLDLAANGPLLVIWDMAITLANLDANNTLRIRSNTTIQALPGCGAIMAANQPAQMWRNYNPTLSTTGTLDRNIKIDGGIWHGNKAGQSGNKPTLMDFVGVDGMEFSGGIEYRLPGGFAWRGTNVYHVYHDHHRVDHGAGNTTGNTDGIHFNGPSRYLTVTNGEYFNCYDDAIAFNADDAWGAGTFTGPFDNAYGEISDITVDNIFFQNGVCGIRLLSGGSRMDRISIKNIKGKSGGYWLVVDNFNGTQEVLAGPGNIGSIEIDGVCMENFVPAVQGTLAGMHFNCKIEQISIRNVAKAKFANQRYPTLLFGPRANVAQVSVDAYKSYPFNNGTYLSDQITFDSGAVIGSMKVNNSQFDAPPSSSGYPITVPSGVTIKQLTLNGNSGMGLTDFVSVAGTVTNLHVPVTNNFMDGATSTSTWTLDSGYTEQSASAVSFSGSISSVQVARKTAQDTFGANIQLSTTLRFTGTAVTGLVAGLLVRGVVLQPYSGSQENAYAFEINQITGIVRLLRSNQGSANLIGTAVTVSGGITMATDYVGRVTAKGSALSARLQRVSDGFYLQTNGTWAATAVDCCSGTDTVLGAGNPLQYGVYSYAYNTNNAVSGITYTNFAAIAAP